MEMTVNVTDLFLIVTTISIIFIMIFLIPLLSRLKQTVIKAERLIDNINHDLPSILSSLDSTASETRILSANINAKLAETDIIISSAKYASESLLQTSNIIRSTLNPAITQIGGLSAGISTLFNVILGSKSKKTKEGQSDE